MWDEKDVTYLTIQQNMVNQDRMAKRGTYNTERCLPAVKHLLWISISWFLSPEYVEESVGLARCLAIPDMHTHHIWGGEGTADVPLGLGYDDVHLRSEHAPQGHCHTQAHCKTSGDDLVVAPKIDRHKRQPDDTSGIHGECNVLGLIEIGRHIASLEGIVSAAHDEESIVAHRSHDTQVAGVADKVNFLNAGVGEDGHGGLQDDQRDHQCQLHTDQNGGNDHLSPRTHETWLAGTNLLFAACQNACNAVGFGHKGRIAHGRRETHQKALEVAGYRGGFSDKGERADITQKDASKDYVAELPTGGFDNRSVPVEHKDKGDKHGDQDPQAGKDHSHNRFYIAPLKVFYRNGFTACSVQKRNRVLESYLLEERSFISGSQYNPNISFCLYVMDY